MGKKELRAAQSSRPTCGGTSKSRVADATTGGPVKNNAVRILCVEGDWKFRNEFTAKQLARYDADFRAGKAFPDQTGIRCRFHAQELNKERTKKRIKCEGCEIWKSGAEYSKRSFKNKTGLCIECTQHQVNGGEGIQFEGPGEKVTTEQRLEIRSAPAIASNAFSSNAVDALIMDHDFDFVDTNKRFNTAASAVFDMNDIDLNDIDVNDIDVNDIDVNDIDVNDIDVNDMGRLPGFAIDFSALPIPSSPSDNEILQAQIGNAPKSGKSGSWAGHNSWFKGKQDWDADEPARRGGWVRTQSRRTLPQVPERLRD
ncbi:hypothetical protein B0T25DRAFT_305039 [Lasiosphaeria hispida]|uniref:Stc1 domain-containing protein n=1 Tax=Lasiosphaeria hispida TaxID=260671 RepID=A0AAJ0H8K5_9PEZI|nr:hypothetical protein B0T25DRAFT_305039 [Lasiosphaeria hispida]